MRPIRAVLEGKYYRLNYEIVRDTIPRVDDLIQWARWLLARDPERGTRTPFADLWTVSFKSEWDSAPYGGILVYYRFTDEHVILESIRPRSEFLGDRPYTLPDPPFDF